MIKIEFDKRTSKDLIRLYTLRPRFKSGIADFFDDMGEALRKSVRRDILFEQKLGRTYLIRLGGRIKKHRASAPEQTAANVTGAYYKSIDFKAYGSNRLVFGSKVKHGKFLEEGTPKMKPRPGLYNAIFNNLANFDRFLEKRVMEKINK
jgi:hypothetical protein